MFHFHGQAIEKSSVKGLDISLITSGDGVEVIHHNLTSGTLWSMIPEAGWDAFEYFVVLSGELRCDTPEGTIVLKNGDSFSAHPVQEHTLFNADIDTEFLYITLQPVYHLYSKAAKEKMELAVADRVYQKGRSPQEALDEIKRYRGSIYHPDVVDVFLSIIEVSQ